jgi:hypothetical protein
MKLFKNIALIVSALPELLEIIKQLINEIKEIKTELSKTK